jgi:two-component system cell cycle response regulator
MLSRFQIREKHGQGDSRGKHLMERILIVDDNPETRAMLRRHLTTEGYKILEAETGEMALEKIKTDLPEVVLLEMMLPDMTGFQICHQLLSTPQSDLVYIILLTTVAGIDYKSWDLDKGADNYVTKPFDIQELLARIRVGLATVKQKQEAVMDPLTKLYNKDFFRTHLAQEVSKAQRYQHHLSLIIGDIDHFKRINDTYGHSVGDAVLVEIGKILRRHCRRSDISVRWGGEAFAILLPETDLMGGMMFAERLCQAIESHQFEGIDQLTASFGVAILTTNRQELIERAELGLSEAKQSGGNKVVFTNK